MSLGEGLGVGFRLVLDEAFLWKIREPGKCSLQDSFSRIHILAGSVQAFIHDWFAKTL